MSDAAKTDPTALTLVVNGSPRTLSAGATVADLLTELGLRRDGVAVAIGMAVVPRGEHSRRQLQDGDRVEVVQAVGGG